jgi:hypothetical protein
MKSVTSLLTTALLGLACTQTGFAQIINSSFSSGLAGWSTAGDVSVASGVATLTTASVLFEDDSPATAGAFNFSGTAAVDNVSALELFAGVAAGTFDPNPASGVFAYEGSIISQGFTALAGDTLTFDWKFLTNEGAQPDYAFVLIDGNLTTLANTINATLSSGIFALETASGTFSYTFSNPATGLVSFGVLDVNDFGVTSALQIDNVAVTAIPEPATYGLLAASAALGFALWRRRKAAV